MRPSRRGFLRTSTLASAAAFLGFSSPAASADASLAAADDLPPAPSWFDRPMRWAQLTLVENDPGKFDVQFWLDYFKRTHSDAVCLSAGGCVAYYPTEIPLHHRSPWLGDRDAFGELVAGCRKLGMVVIARTDPHATYDDVQAAHPGLDRGRRRRPAAPPLGLAGDVGHLRPRALQLRVHDRGQARDHAPLPGRRHLHQPLGRAPACATASTAGATSRPPPATTCRARTTRRIRRSRDYILWRQERLFELWRLWDAAVRKINPDACVIPNAGGGATSRLDMKRIGELAPMLFADRQARRGLMPPWANGKNGKEFRATLGRKPIGRHLQRRASRSPIAGRTPCRAPAEIRLWVADGVANGLRPWFTKFAGALTTARWLKPVEDIYRWYHGAERYLRNEPPLARVGLVYSQQTAWFYGGAARASAVEDHTLGWYHALIEARMPFEMVHDRLLDAEHLAPFKTLILPNIAALSDAQCAQLRDVRAARRRPRRHPRDLALRRVGRAARGLRPGRSLRRRASPAGSRARCRTPTCASSTTRHPGHPLLAGLEDAPRIINGVWQLEVKANACRSRTRR